MNGSKPLTVPLTCRAPFNRTGFVALGKEKSVSYVIVPTFYKNFDNNLTHLTLPCPCTFSTLVDIPWASCVPSKFDRK